MSTTNPINRTTEWDDLQIKYGNYAPANQETKAEAVSQKAQDAILEFDPLEGKSVEDLDALEGVDEDVVEKYRRARLAELRSLKAKARFSGVYLVSMDNYVEQVTLGSDNNTTVILHLFDDSVPACHFINNCFEELSQKHREVKFCKGRASSILQKFNIKNLPTIIVYKNKNCIHQIMGTSIFNTESPTSAVMEYVLAKKFNLLETSQTEDPRKPGGSRLSKYLRGGEDDSEEDVEEPNAADLHVGASEKGYGNVDLDNLMQLIRK